MCLSLLHEIFPPGTVYIVGAGSGNSKFIHWAHAKSLTDVVLIEGVEKNISNLKASGVQEFRGGNLRI